MPGKVTFISYYPITQTPGERLCNSENSSWAQRKPKERKGSSHLGQNGDTLHQRHPRGSSAFLLLSPSPHLMFLLSSLIFLQVFSFSYMTCWQLARESSQKRAHFSGNPASLPVKGRQRREVAETKEIQQVQTGLGNSNSYLSTKTDANVSNSYLVQLLFINVYLSRYLKHQC